MLRPGCGGGCISESIGMVVVFRHSWSWGESLGNLSCTSGMLARRRPIAILRWFRWTRPAVRPAADEYPYSDGKIMAETPRHVDAIFYAMATLRTWFATHTAQRRVLEQLKAFCAFCAEEGWIADSPAKGFRKPKAEARPRLVRSRARRGTRPSRAATGSPQSIDGLCGQVTSLLQHVG